MRTFNIHYIEVCHVLVSVEKLWALLSMFITKCVYLSLICLFFLLPLIRIPSATTYHSTTSSWGYTMNPQGRAPGGCSTQKEGRPGKLLDAEPPPWTTAANCWRAGWGPSRPRSRREQPAPGGRCKGTGARGPGVQTAPTRPSSFPNGGSTAAAPRPAAAWMTLTCGPPSVHAQALMPAPWADVCPPSLLDKRTTTTCLRMDCWGDTLPGAWPPPSPRPSWRSWIWSMASHWSPGSRQGPVPAQPHRHLPLRCPPPPPCCPEAPASPPSISCNHPASRRPPPTLGPRPPSLSADPAAKSRRPSATPSSTPSPAPALVAAATTAPTCPPAWKPCSPLTPPLRLMSWWPRWTPSCRVPEVWAWWIWVHLWWVWGPNPISCCWVRGWSRTPWPPWPPWRFRPRCSLSSGTITSSTSSTSSRTISRTSSSSSTSSSSYSNNTSITLRWAWGWSSQVCLKTRHSSPLSKPSMPRGQRWAPFTEGPASACRRWVSSELRPVSPPVRTGCPQTWTLTCSRKTWIATWTTSSTVTSWTETALISTLTPCLEAKAPPTTGSPASSSADNAKPGTLIAPSFLHHTNDSCFYRFIDCLLIFLVYKCQRIMKNIEKVSQSPR